MKQTKTLFALLLCALFTWSAVSAQSLNLTSKARVAKSGVPKSGTTIEYTYSTPDPDPATEDDTQIVTASSDYFTLVHNRNNVTQKFSSKAGDWRIYSGHSLTITMNSGYVLDSMVLTTYTANSKTYHGAYNYVCTPSTVTVTTTQDNLESHYVFSAAISSVTMTATAQGRIVSGVFYIRSTSGSGGTTPTTTTVTINPSSLNFGSVEVGETKSATFTVTTNNSSLVWDVSSNIGMYRYRSSEVETIDITDITPLTYNFSNGLSKTFQITVSPVEEGTFVGGLSFTYGNGENDEADLDITITGIVSSTPSDPSDYYAAAAGKTGYQLKTALHNIIKTTHTNVVSYTPGVWSAYETTDRRPDGKIWDMYSNCDFTYRDDQCGSGEGECGCYNREHSFPKNWFGGEVSPMYTDLFHIYPTSAVVNSKRSNFPFGEVSTDEANFTNSNAKFGYNTFGNEYTGKAFEPEDQYKGDFARTYFYMATRYEDLIANWNNCKNQKVCNGTSDQAFSDWTLALLLKWHHADPVSTKETARNNAVYDIQGNRNPFIDHPEWVDSIWNRQASSTNPDPEPETTYTLAQLRQLSADNSTEYTVGSICAITAVGSQRNQKWVQDASGAGIQIDDNSGVILGTYQIGDNISGLKGKLTTYNGTLQFIPSVNATKESTVTVSVSPTEVASTNGFGTSVLQPIEGKLITVKSCRFNETGGTFYNGQNTTATCNGQTLNVRTHIFNTTVKGMTIPTEEVNITGIVVSYKNNGEVGYYLCPRRAEDIEIVQSTQPDPQVTLTALPYTCKFTSMAQRNEWSGINNAFQIVINEEGGNSLGSATVSQTGLQYLVLKNPVHLTPGTDYHAIIHGKGSNNFSGGMVLCTDPADPHNTVVTRQNKYWPGEQPYYVYGFDFSVSEEGNYYFAVYSEIPTAGDYAIFTDIRIDEGRYENITVWELVSPVSAMGLTTQETVTVKIVNSGNTVINTPFQLTLKVDGTLVETYTVNNLNDITDLVGTATLTFNNKADLSADGSHTITISHNYSGDVYPDDNTLTKTVVNRQPLSLPYTCNFSDENELENWTVIDGSDDGYKWERSNDYWVDGIGFIYRAGIETNAMQNGQRDYLITSPIRIPDAGTYHITFKAKAGNDDYYEALAVLMGSSNTPSSMTTLTGEMLASTEWTMFSCNITIDAAGIYYFGFANTMRGDALYITDIKIAEGAYNNIEVKKILTPVSGCNLGNAEPVTVLVKNNGAGTVSNLGYTVNINGEKYNATSNTLIGKGQEQQLTVGFYDFSNEGTYNISVTVTAAEPAGEDADITDNHATVLIVNKEAVNVPYTSNFNPGGNGWDDWTDISEKTDYHEKNEAMLLPGDKLIVSRCVNLEYGKHYNFSVNCAVNLAYLNDYLYLMYAPAGTSPVNFSAWTIVNRLTTTGQKWLNSENIISPSSTGSYQFAIYTPVDPYGAKVYIRDVSVKEMKQYDVSIQEVSGINMIPADLAQNYTEDLLVRVKNNGYETVDISVEVDGQQQSASGLAPFATTLVGFEITASGNYNQTVNKAISASIPGETDQNPEDNTYTHAIVITDDILAKDAASEDCNKCYTVGSMDESAMNLGMFISLPVRDTLTGVTALFGQGNPYTTRITVYSVDITEEGLERGENPVYETAQPVDGTAGWHTFELPPVVLQPGYYVVSVSVVGYRMTTDNSSGILYTVVDGNRTVYTQGGFGYAAIRAVFGHKQINNYDAAMRSFGPAPTMVPAKHTVDAYYSIPFTVANNGQTAIQTAKVEFTLNGTKIGENTVSDIEYLASKSGVATITLNNLQASETAMVLAGSVKISGHENSEATPDNNTLSKYLTVTDSVLAYDACNESGAAQETGFYGSNGSWSNVGVDMYVAQKDTLTALRILLKNGYNNKLNVYVFTFNTKSGEIGGLVYSMFGKTNLEATAGWTDIMLDKPLELTAGHYLVCVEYLHKNLVTDYGTGMLYHLYQEEEEWKYYTETAWGMPAVRAVFGTPQQPLPEYYVEVLTDCDICGSVQGSGVYRKGQKVVIKAEPAAGYVFNGWNDGNMEAERTVTVMGDVTYTASFIRAGGLVVTTYRITVGSDNEEQGTVSAGGVYKEGTEVTITAYPKSGYEFDYWNTGAANGDKDNPRTVVVTADAEYIAHFKKTGGSGEDSGNGEGGGEGQGGNETKYLPVEKLAVELDGRNVYLSWKVNADANPEPDKFNVYLDDEKDGSTTKKNYEFERVAYGDHTAAVEALYGENKAEKIYISFTVVDPNAANEDGPGAAMVCVYPNPTKGVVNISGEYSRLIVMNVNGKVVRDVAGVKSLSLSGEPDGVYFFRFTTPAGLRTVKVIK